METVLCCARIPTTQFVPRCRQCSIVIKFDRFPSYSTYYAQRQTVCKVEKRLLVMAAQSQRCFFPIKVELCSISTLLPCYGVPLQQSFPSFTSSLDKFKGHYRMSISRDHAFFLKFNLGEYPTLAKAMGFLRKAGHRQVYAKCKPDFCKAHGQGFYSA